MICKNCGKEFEPKELKHDWTPCCDIFCNGAQRFIEEGTTIFNAAMEANPRFAARMVRNIFDAHEFWSAMKVLANIKIALLTPNVKLTGCLPED